MTVDSNPSHHSPSGSAPSERVRCAWVSDDAGYQRYHDEEWGVPERDERKLFEALTLEGAQAGLSWLTILRKREGYRRAFAGFDPEVLAVWGPDDVERLVQDASIVRHRGKIESTLSNARALLALRESGRTLSEYAWDFVDGSPIVGHWRDLSEVPSHTPLAVRLSKDLKSRGFRFVGPTTCYSFLQAAGLVMDHTVDCFCYDRLS